MSGGPARRAQAMRRRSGREQTHRHTEISKY
ncbi:hypothetical protein GSH05_32935 [Burkholderia pseudomallei]|nr:hypothetical protein CXQ84_00165 [Burkholderia pseudomallei]AYX08341.1 hypothetical protein EGY14_33255 [Burkholderia pseudomallei]AYX29998.1 hypothetical protein EGY16_19475 [Burkholderia pseudomallei]AYX34794.1 hypothetical protein EGY15_06180 [Burkholderia pseudomallei]KAA8769297.1 hypothetical protein F5D26_08570 [Burkholderia pseudomallei]